MTTKILVVDDDYITRKGLTEILREFGYMPLAVESGENAIKMVKNKDFTLALVDLKMPGMDGLEVLKALKAIKPHIYVVIMTAYATIDTAIESMKLGAFDYLRKPFKIEEVNDLIKSIIVEEKLENNLKGFDVRIEKNAIKFFQSKLKREQGMVITKDNPEVLRQGLELRNITMYWLTANENGKECIDPKNLDKVYNVIEAFIHANNKSIILINGIDLLIESNSWAIVKEFLASTIESINSKDSTLIISAIPETLDEITLLEIEDIFTVNYTQNISESLANPIRRTVLHYLSIAKKSSFTDILRNIEEKESPKLSFHIKKLCSAGVIDKDEKGIYYLTKRGETLLPLLNSIEGEGRKEPSIYLLYDGETKNV